MQRSSAGLLAPACFDIVLMASLCLIILGSVLSKCNADCGLLAARHHHALWHVSFPALPIVEVPAVILVLPAAYSIAEVVAAVPVKRIRHEVHLMYAPDKSAEHVNACTRPELEG